MCCMSEICVFTGRLFYKCAKPQDSGCGFFLWATDNAQSNATSGYSSWTSTMGRNDGGAGSAGHSSHTNTSNNDWGYASSNDVMCSCNQPARK